MAELDFYLNSVRAQGHEPIRTLIVFDIDNTLLAMKQSLGSDQWYNWKSDLIKKHNPRLFGSLLKWQGILFDHGSMRLTENGLDSKILSFQSRHPVIGLTSRSPYYRVATERELANNRINLKKTSIGGASPGKIRPKGHKRLVSYENGVFMTSGLHKGEMLIYLLNRIYGQNMPITQVIFVDDHLKNTKRVFESLRSQGIEIISLRYSKEDSNVRKFHNSPQAKELADRKLQYLHKTLLNLFARAPDLI